MVAKDGINQFWGVLPDEFICVLGLLCQHGVYVNWQLQIDNGDKVVDCGNYLEFWCF